MEKKIISFKGISNVPDDGLNEAGDMSVLLNMRHKGGELVPCQPPTETIQLNVDKALYHANSGCWILLANGNLEAKKADYSKVLVWAREKYVTSFALMGNIVIINFADGVEYAIWRNGEYEYLGGLPEVPRMRCDLSFKTVKTELAKYYGGIREAETAGYSNLWEGYNKKGQLDVCLSNLYDSGAYIDFANFRLALKLFDGTFKAISPIYLVNGTRKTSTDKDTTGGLDNFRWQSNTNYTSENEYWAEVEGFIPSFELEEYDFENWSDIVSSVCLFTSGSLPMHGAKKGVPEYMLEQLLSNDYEDYLPLTAEEFKENLLYANYYKVAEYDLKGKLIDSVRNTSPSNLAQQDILILKDLNDYANSSQICINSRLHIYEFKTLFPHGFADIWAYGGNNDDVDKIVVKTFIKTENGNAETIAECANCKTAISSLLTYPNRDAYKMDVYVKKATMQPGLSERQFNLYYKSFELTKDNAFAYYINPKCWQINSIEITSDLDYNVEVANANWILDKFGAGTLNVVYDENGFWTINGTREVATAFFKLGKPKAGDSFTVKISKNNPVAFWDYLKLDMESATVGNTEFKDAQLQWVNIGDSAYKTVKDFTVHKTKGAADVIIKNVLKVSAVDNPFYFPTAQTYKFEGEIKGLASNAEAISPGQFGTFPLYVFTDTGIWAMQVDASGQGAYLSQAPSSREVCSGAICPVSGGVVFTTKRGVMAISGGQVTELSKPLDGLEEMLFNFSGALAGQIFARAGFDNYTKFEPVPIREYIQGESGAKLAYNYLHNEVILSNPDEKYKYSYVYSLDSQTWGMIDTKFDITTNSYPELVVYNNQEMKRYTFDDTTTGVVPVVAITRPFTLGSFDLKRLRQAALRCTFDGQLNFYVLGSIDGAVFKCITGKEAAEVKGENGEVKTRRDLITAMSRSKQYKYFAIAIVGQMSGRVSMAELLVDAGFANNKLR